MKTANELRDFWATGHNPWKAAEEEILQRRQDEMDEPERITIRDRVWSLIEKGFSDETISEHTGCSVQYSAFVRSDWEILKQIEEEDRYYLNRGNVRRKVNF